MASYNGPDVTRSEARRFLNTLLDGVPPLSHLTSWLTVGQERLLRIFHEDLKAVADGESRCLLLLGNPGTGKSQLLITLDYLAMSKGLVSAYFSQDVQSKLGFNRPDQIYQRIMETMRLPDNRAGTEDALQTVLDKWVNLSLPSLRSTNRSMAIIYKLSQVGLLPSRVEQVHRRTGLALVGYIMATEQQNQDARMQFLNVLKGPGITNTRLIETGKTINLHRRGFMGYTPSAYDTDYYFGQLGTLTFILRSIGYKGMTVLFDEVTAIVDLASRSREKAYKVLDSLFVNEQDSQGLYTVFAYMPPFITQLRADRQLVGQEHLQRWGYLFDRRMTELAPLVRTDMEELLRRLLYLHGIAREWPASDFIGQPAQALVTRHQENDLPTRDLVRGALDLFDRLHETQH